MNYQTLYKTLQKELSILQKKAFEVHAAKDLEQKVAKLNYQKLQLIKQRIPSTDIDHQIANLKKNGLESPEFDPVLLNKLVKELDYTKKDSHLIKVKLQQLQNLSTFLRSQREYTELLERYNPGLTMKQDDKVRRTANRVGLSVPE